MCGIVGVVHKNKTLVDKNLLQNAVKTLAQRGPDNQSIEIFNHVGLGHARLSIIDTSTSANQPFTDYSGRYTLVYNGEIYNYQSLKSQLQFKDFKTSSDTEVLLYWLIEKGSEGIKQLHGFFAFCLFDHQNESFLLARDRFGIKPLLIYEDEQKWAFASEMKALFALDIQKNLDIDSLHLYFKFNYIPSPYSILQNVFKLQAGEFMEVDKNGVKTTQTYYSIGEEGIGNSSLNYENAQKELRKKLEESVCERLIADVPLGTFLSGGIDSSVITGLASQHVKNLNSFSIGYADEPLFDETHYANLVAKKFKTEHTVFKLSNQNLFEQLDKVLEYTDEPFADSSGLAVNILCELTKKNVTVALSGDGADEVFSGYNKHLALFQANQKTAKNTIIKSIHPLTSVLPQSRNSKIGNLNRQLAKFGEGLRLNHIDRYWLWAGLRNEDENNKLIIPHTKHYKERKDEILKYLQSPNDFNQVLLTDCKLVLQGDMLTKVDLNSMCQSLEVRVPFLDHRVVNFAFQLPSKFKIDGTFKKKIVQDAFRDFLPKELYKRPKHGFEVPLLNWFKTDMYDKIFNQYLHPSFIIEQNIFEWAEVEKLRKKLLSNSPEDSTATIWALVVFQHWYKKYML